MAISQTLTYTVNSGGQQYSDSIIFSTDGTEVRDFVVPGSGAITAQNFTLDVSQLKMIWVRSDTALTINFNKASGSVDIVLVAGQPFVWHNLSLLANPFDGDIVSITATNATAGAALLQIRAAIDATV